MAQEPRLGGKGQLGPSLECGALLFVHRPAPFLPVPSSWPLVPLFLWKITSPFYACRWFGWSAPSEPL